MWRMMQKKKPSDYVISTGKQFTVKQFVNLVLNELGIKFRWRGTGINEKCFDQNGKCIVACDKEYFRPLEVDTLLGNSKKAKKELNWWPKTSINKLVNEMVNFDLKKLAND
jgi:GDPmannose 4,6-dehydratase